MTDAEGIRNLVGTGLVQLTGGILTAIIALGVLFYLNWQLTLVTIVVLGAFGGVDGDRLQAAAAAVPRARQDQRRGHRPAVQSLGGIRIVKAYTAEKREEIVFSRASIACCATSPSR